MLSLTHQGTQYKYLKVGIKMMLFAQNANKGISGSEQFNTLSATNSNKIVTALNKFWEEGGQA